MKIYNVKPRLQNRRQAAFLERKKKLPLADEVTPTTYDNQVCRQGGADLLDKKTASSGQTSATKVETAVDKDCSLNLNPNPTCPWGSNESMESDMIPAIERYLDNGILLLSK